MSSTLYKYKRWMRALNGFSLSSCSRIAGSRYFERRPSIIAIGRAHWVAERFLIERWTDKTSAPGETWSISDRKSYFGHNRKVCRWKEMATFSAHTKPFAWDIARKLRAVNLYPVLGYRKSPSVPDSHPALQVKYLSSRKFKGSQCNSPDNITRKYHRERIRDTFTTRQQEYTPVVRLLTVSVWQQISRQKQGDPKLDSVWGLIKWKAKFMIMKHSFKRFFTAILVIIFYWLWWCVWLWTEPVSLRSP